jgi:hypothetical protein
MITPQRLLPLAGALLATCVLVLPGAASARGGGGGGGTATPLPATCVAVTPLNSNVIDKPASHKPITVDLQLTNCGSQTVSTRTTLVGTTTTVRSLDPLVESTCSTAPYAAGSLTLKPGESRVLNAAAQLPYCGYSLWGVIGSYDVEYVATVTNVADGSLLTTASSWVLHRTGV